ncbi:hypothetical protein NUW58_g5348 [Xylaria curta]|uniref:Uncharacterized protein n=1 Tax=Xylaria curta TaxID=42375 RepID=A0ACC1P3I7_9PEZI|nr:hypothetical protein NUW58_g5348 [Xylaria curta]
MGRLQKAERVDNAGHSDGGAAPPSYDAPPSAGMSPEDVDQLNSAFSSLRLPLVTKEVTVDTCLAHLKLLFAFQNLKESIGYSDGLWQIYDNRVLRNNKKGADALNPTEALDDETKKNLALLREKRWALYVARAADRYEAWWNSFSRNRLKDDDMCEDTSKYTRFASHPPSEASTTVWESSMLPPLGKEPLYGSLGYLEDCMRHGLRELWHLGIQWQLVNNAIDTNFNYIVSDDCMAIWEQTTGRKWDNTDDSFFKLLPPCPSCGIENVVPWSTCGMAEDSKNEPPSIAGWGYGDAEFITTCSGCGKMLRRDYLEVLRFTTDVQNLLAHQYPVPGTLLESTGMPKQIPPTGNARYQLQRTFPNRLIQHGLRSRLYDPPPASMESVRAIIEKALADSDIVKQAESVAEKDKDKSYRLGQEARVHVRKMMSRYWNNTSPFALDLRGAVMRQGIFTEKMYKMDWLHSPAARETMARLVNKYGRFTEIIRKTQTKTAVPTLDIDLAWHTHQLSPGIYYKWMCSKTGKFVDHDDKIDENKLTASFEWTSKLYQDIYGEVYSECTCWYCESVRTSHVSGITDRLPILQSQKDKASDRFYESGRAALCPPDNSAHISAHNSVQLTDNNDSKLSRIRKQLHLRNQKRLEDNYEKARKRAKRKGRDLPPRDDYYYYYWGAPYLLYAPYVYPTYYVCPVYYDASAMAAGSGYYGACAAGITGLTVHCRTTPMRPRERAIRGQLRMIANVCHEAGVACVMNGDVEGRDEAVRLMQEFGVDGAMIATQAEKNSSCFQASADGGLLPWTDVVKQYTRYALEVENKFGNTKFMFTQLIPGKAPVYREISQCKSYTKACELLGYDDLMERAGEVDLSLDINPDNAGKKTKTANTTALAAGGQPAKSRAVSSSIKKNLSERGVQIPSEARANEATVMSV